MVLGYFISNFTYGLKLFFVLPLYLFECSVASLYIKVTGCLSVCSKRFRYPLNRYAMKPLNNPGEAITFFWEDTSTFSGEIANSKIFKKLSH